MNWYPEPFSSVADLGQEGWYIRDDEHRTRGVLRYFRTGDEFQQVWGAELFRVHDYTSAVEPVVKWTWSPPGAEPSITPQQAAERLQAMIEEEK